MNNSNKNLTSAFFSEAVLSLVAYMFPGGFLYYFLGAHAILTAYSDYEANLIRTVQVFLMVSRTWIGCVVEMKGVHGLGSQVNWTSPPSTTYERNNCGAFLTSLRPSGPFLKIQIALNLLLVNGKHYLELAWRPGRAHCPNGPFPSCKQFSSTFLF